ncbi:hypothetical protein ELS19_02800 [Halogeometricum borinquense]|uniref:Uncharacterized protein n=1 Tax=Halogeometricum borinquense TaxID=60847 RepID=A0A482T5S7_9EURY|nr:hypothetical protein [Halogeometricum borinquense]RYJ13000.1 hypothetical protein ELS19_02800 [Halogeometricum borinquense]
MSHTPDLPEQYVCKGCQAIYAGTVLKRGDTHHFEAPAECSACGSTAFVPLEQYIHEAGQSA